MIASSPIAVIAQSEGDRGIVGEVGDEIRVTFDRWSVGQLGVADLVTAGVVLLAGAVLAWLANRIARRYARRLNGATRAAVVSTGLVLATGLMLVAAAITLEVLGFSLGPILVLILIATVVLLLTQPLLTNLSSGLLLQLRGALADGDLVLTEGVFGTVYEVNARSVVIDTPNGHRVHVPNRDVAHSTIANYSELGRRRSSFELMVDHRADLDALRSTILAAVASEAEVLDEPSPETRLVGLRGRFVTVEVLVWHRPGPAEKWRAVTAAVRAAVAACGDGGIDLDGPDLVWPADGLGSAGEGGGSDGRNDG